MSATLKATGLSAGHGARVLFTGLDLVLAPGDVVGLVGANGAGKSTLLSALAAAYDPALEHYDSQAAIRFNPSCRLVYFDQSMRDLPIDRDILDFVVEAEGVTEKEAIRVLAQAGFAFARVREPIGVLSHGERARLVFLFVSHDRFFTRTAATRFLEIRRGRLLEIDDPDAFFDAQS